MKDAVTNMIPISQQMTRHVALLRGINVGGRNAVPMPVLRAVCRDLGWDEVQTYIQSGNVLFRAAAAQVELERDLECAIEAHFGMAIPVIIRTAAEWQMYSGDNPYADVSSSEPNRVMIALSKAVPTPEAMRALQQRANSKERVVLVRGALWVYFSDGAGRSRLSTALFDRLVGSPVTMRNWRTVVKLAELVRA
jgi:uncharacterized protein (DUF1697 family)